MFARQITTVKELHHYLHVAMQLEHATIPPYLLALYSIRPGTNADATRILRVIAVEEMLHLTQVANILNAVDGEPDLTGPKFVPDYPATLPDGETDFTVSLRPFSRAAVETFLKIERPKKAPSPDHKLVRHRAGSMSIALKPPNEDEFYYYSVGEFYAAIADGLRFLDSDSCGKLFSGDCKRQISPQHYYSGGGKLTVVTNLDSAIHAVNRIIEQGEGFDSGVFTGEGELAHDFRFEQLKLGRYYQPMNASGRPDEPGHPTGSEINVDWDAVYPVQVNPKLSDYEDSPDLHAAAVAFNETYADFLKLLTKAYRGESNLLFVAVPRMFSLSNQVLELIRVPMPGKASVNAGPTFELA